MPKSNKGYVSPGLTENLWKLLEWYFYWLGVLADTQPLGPVTLKTDSTAQKFKKNHFLIVYFLIYYS